MKLIEILTHKDLTKNGLEILLKELTSGEIYVNIDTGELFCSVWKEPVEEVWGHIDDAVDSLNKEYPVDEPGEYIEYYKMIELIKEWLL